MIKTPIGVVWRKGFVRCCSDCFDKPYLIQEMQRSHNNIVPVVVIDIVTKKGKCFLINDTMTDFDEITTQQSILCKRVEHISDYMINKKNIQKSNLSVEDKEISIELNSRKNYDKQKLSTVDNDKLTDFINRMV